MRPDEVAKAADDATETGGAERGHCPFPEEHLSGLLDGVLTRVESARVTQHLEHCEQCNELYLEFVSLRETAQATEFQVPLDDQWDETPRSSLSAWVRNVGWALSLTVVVGFTWLSLAADGAETVERVSRWLAVGAVGAVLCLLASAAIDRLHLAPNDLYRGVRK